MDGVLKKGQRDQVDVERNLAPMSTVIGVFRPEMQMDDSLGPGEIGFLTASIKQVRDTRVGDTITHDRNGCEAPLPGFKPAQPVVFCGLCSRWIRPNSKICATPSTSWR